MKNGANKEAGHTVLKPVEDEGQLTECGDLSDKINFEFSSLKQFGVLSVPLLKTFIATRNDTLT